jgi:hypothetical protein
VNGEPGPSFSLVSNQPLFGVRARCKRFPFQKTYVTGRPWTGNGASQIARAASTSFQPRTRFAPTTRAVPLGGPRKVTL